MKKLLLASADVPRTSGMGDAAIREGFFGFVAGRDDMLTGAVWSDKRLK